MYYIASGNQNLCKVWYHIAVVTPALAVKLLTTVYRLVHNQRMSVTAALTSLGKHWQSADRVKHIYYLHEVDRNEYDEVCFHSFLYLIWV